MMRIASVLTKASMVVTVMSVASSTMAFATPNNGSNVVLVTGAGGKTGGSLFRKLVAAEEYAPIGICRSDASKQALVDSGLPSDIIEVCDVTDPEAIQSVVSKYGDDVVALCIATSATPAPTGEMNEGRPVFGFPNGQPEQVDWIGQKNQIDAVPSGVHVVICSTMGGSDESNPLNAIGRTTNEDGSVSGGNIVMWKRKAEKYLMDSDKKWTIVHPGGLLNEPGGERELVVGVDDVIDQTESRSVPREDVAEVMLQALRLPAAFVGRSFDLRSKPVGEGEPTTDFVALMDTLAGKNCDYSLGKIAGE